MSLTMQQQQQQQQCTMSSALPTINDFEMIKGISCGAFGEVHLAKRYGDNSGQLFAIKKVAKSTLVKKNLVNQMRSERDALAMSHSRHVVHLYYSLQTEANVYLVTEYLCGGDLKSLLSVVGCLQEDHAILYTAEIVLALEHLHKHRIIHRDIKPDNMLISATGHLKLTDFGLSQVCVTNRPTLEDLLQKTPGGLLLSAEKRYPRTPRQFLSMATELSFGSGNHSASAVGNGQQKYCNTINYKQRRHQHQQQHYHQLFSNHRNSLMKANDKSTFTTAAVASITPSNDNNNKNDNNPAPPPPFCLEDSSDSNNTSRTSSKHSDHNISNNSSHNNSQLSDEEEHYQQQQEQQFDLSYTISPMHTADANANTNSNSDRSPLTVLADNNNIVNNTIATAAPMSAMKGSAAAAAGALAGNGQVRPAHTVHFSSSVTSHASPDLPNYHHQHHLHREAHQTPNSSATLTAAAATSTIGTNTTASPIASSYDNNYTSQRGSGGQNNNENNQLLGTPDYLAPELIIAGAEHGTPVDYWALGVCLFEFLAGYRPFSDASPELIMNNILSRDIPWPGEEEAEESENPDEPLISELAVDAINGLLEPQPHKRFASTDLRQHPLFAQINWDTMHLTEMPFVPRPDSDTDTAYFMPRNVAIGYTDEED